MKRRSLAHMWSQRSVAHRRPAMCSARVRRGATGDACDHPRLPRAEWFRVEAAERLSLVCERWNATSVTCDYGDAPGRQPRRVTVTPALAMRPTDIAIPGWMS